MKKALSLFLAILMIFSVLSVSSFATGSITPADNSTADTATIQQKLKEAGVMTDNDCVLKFYTLGGKFMGDQLVFDMTTGKFVAKSPDQLKTLGDPYVKFPNAPGDQEPGKMVALPDVEAPSGYKFNGWYCVEDGSTSVAGISGYLIKDHFVTVDGRVGESTAGKTITFRAIYVPAEVEEPVFNKVFDILAKIFGTIIGLIAYEGDTAAGIAFVRKMFEGITE